MSSPAPVTAEMNAISPARGCSPESDSRSVSRNSSTWARMRGVVDGNPRGRHVIPLAHGHELVQRRCVPGDDGRRRTVLRGNGNRFDPMVRCSARTRSTGRGIETMPPVPAIALIALLRNVTTFAASRNERAPAT